MAICVRCGESYRILPDSSDTCEPCQETESQGRAGMTGQTHQAVVDKTRDWYKNRGLSPRAVDVLLKLESLLPSFSEAIPPKPDIDLVGLADLLYEASQVPLEEMPGLLVELHWAVRSRLVD